MLDYRGRYQLYLVLAICVGCILALCAPTKALAYTGESPGSRISLNVNIGFYSTSYSTYRIGEWTPVNVTMTNQAKSFKGTLAVNTEAGSLDPNNITYRSPWQFTRAITLPANSQQQATLYVPIYYDSALTPGVTVSILDSAGKTVTTQTAVSQFEAKPGNLMIGLLSDIPNNLNVLNMLDLPNQTAPLVVALNADTFPNSSSSLNTFDVLVLDDFATQNLHTDQLLALKTWVNNGGILIIAGGAQWQRTVEALPADIQPVNISGTTLLPAHSRLLQPKDPEIQTDEQKTLSSPLPMSVDLSTANPRLQNTLFANKIILTTGTIPLFIEASQGQGTICYTAVDMADPNLQNWPGLYELWRTLLLHSLGDQLLLSSTTESYTTGPGSILTHAGLLTMLQPGMLPGPLVILLMLFGYAIILGPIRFIIARKTHRPYAWSWRIFMISVLLFSLFSYFFAAYQRNSSIIDNTISLINLNQDGTTGHITTYSGLFVPNQGDFALHVPGENLTQPLANQFQVTNSQVVTKTDSDAGIVITPTATDLSLPKLPPWTLHYTATDQDVQFHGKLLTNLAMVQNKLIGTVTNTLPTDINDLYILLPHSFATIGHIASGQTLHIHTALIAAPQQPGKTLADQIAVQGGLVTPYFPYNNNNQPQTDFQRHMALLSALDGAGFTFAPCQGPCKVYALTEKNTIFITGGRVPNPSMNTYEPLLLNNTPATLIGWANKSLTTDTTINGWHPPGRSDNFIQMPLNISVANASQLPASMISGQVINVDSYDAEQTLSGIYTMMSGTITFELTMPDTDRALPHGLTLNEPDLWANPFGPGTPVNGGHMRAKLYNWLTNSWNTITFKQDSSTITNMDAYVGPNGRILLQLTNQDETLGKLYFGKPSLSFRT